MKIFIDTNVLISAALSPYSVSYKAYKRAVSYPNHALICDQNVEELKTVFNRKFPNRISSLEKFLTSIFFDIEIVNVPNEITSQEGEMRDLNDRGILRAAIISKADIILTGDKDFLDMNLEHPVIMTPGEFLKNSY